MASPRSVADEAEIVFGCLPSLTACKHVTAGGSGVIEGSKVRVYVEMSTLGLAGLLEVGAGLASAGIQLLDAPVSGGPHGAAAGTLSIIAAGPKAVLDRVSEVLNAISTKVIHVGEAPGQAQICKLVNNAISIASAAISYEAVVVGVKAGIPASTLIDVINASTGRNSTTTNRFPNSILRRIFSANAPLAISLKDIHLYLQEAEKAGVPSFVGSNVAQLWQLAASEMGTELDSSSVIKLFERWAGVEVKGSDPAGPDGSKKGAP